MRNNQNREKTLRSGRFFRSGQRIAGDLQTRHNANATIAEALVNTFSPLVLSTVMTVFYLVVMLRYSPPLTLVGLLSVFLNLLMSRLISRKRINITRVQMRDEGKLAAATVSGIQMVETIKASGAETGYFQRWAGYQASVNTQATRFTILNQYLGIIPVFVTTLANSLVLVLGVWLCMRRQFTLGMVTAFQSFLAGFMSPAMTLISAGQTIQEMRTQMERIDDVMEYPEDVCFAAAPREEDGIPVALLPGITGRYHLRDAGGNWGTAGSATAERLEETAICFYNPLPRTKLGIPELLRYMKGCLHTGDYVLLLELTLLVTVTGALLPRITKLLGGFVLESGNPLILWSTAVFMLCVLISSQLLSASRALAMDRLQIKVALPMEAAMMMRLMSLPALFFRQFSVGELASRSASTSPDFGRRTPSQGALRIWKYYLLYEKSKHHERQKEYRPREAQEERRRGGRGGSGERVGRRRSL